MIEKVFRVLLLCCSTLAVLGQYHHHRNHHEQMNHQPAPYNFGYAVQDGLHGGHFRKEEGDAGGAVRGSYGYTDPNGLRREVHYVADHNGFRAQVKTNEPGTLGGHPADVGWFSSGAQAAGHQQFRHRL